MPLNKKQCSLVISAYVLSALVALSPYLPGPSNFSPSVNKLFIFIQIGSLLSLLILSPIGIFGLLKSYQANQPKVWPHILCGLPLWLILISFWGANWARAQSRKIAIANATSIISALANYKSQHKEYPPQLAALSPQYIDEYPTTGVMGIAEYQYSAQATNYTLSFSQNVLFGFNLELMQYQMSDSAQSDKGGWTLHIID